MTSTAIAKTIGSAEGKTSTEPSRHRRTLRRTAVAGGACGVLLLGTGPAHAAASPVATWDMNEPAGATTMIDSSSGMNGQIGTEVITGATYDNATGYRFPYVKPNTPPVHPEHIVRVDHNPSLDPGLRPYTVELRYRTTEKFGNIAQKGQAGAGSYWKFQAPQGYISCLFRGTQDSNAVRSTTRINNGQWQTVRCDHTPGTANKLGSVVMYVNGVKQGTNRGTTGPITNDQPVYIGGKGNCDQVTITCDYFVGDIDYVRITAG